MFFLLHVCLLVVLFSSAFCVPSSVSEVLGFSASNTRVVTVTALRTLSPFFHFTLGTFSIPVFSSLCLLCGCFWLVGQATCDWESVLVSMAFSGGFDRVLGALGFLLPPCAFW